MAKDKSIRDEPNKDRLEAYPQKNDSEQQNDHQPEFVDQQPNNFSDKSVSDISAPAGTKQNNEPHGKKGS